MSYIDSTFYSKLEKLHKIKFDWRTNCCGFFVGKVLEHIHKKDFLAEFRDKVKDEQTNWDLIKSKGGWHSVLINSGFVKRNDKIMYPGDVVICENAIGISDGYKGLFSGGTFRSRTEITDVYYYSEK
jgi:hypothetical protein